MSYKKVLSACLFFAICYGCGPTGKYAASNSSYKKQAKAFGKELAKQPNNIDSAMMASEWVGTTNFGMRKPNFVIIHHTAQTACDTTLRTFTLPRTSECTLRDMQGWHYSTHAQRLPACLACWRR